MSKEPFSLRWTEVWTMAITRPQPETYGTLLQDTNTRLSRAITWLFLTSLLSTLALFNALMTTQEFQEAMTLLLAENGISSVDVNIGQVLFFSALFAAPISAFFMVLGWLLLGRVIQFIADQMGAPQLTKGRFSQLMYCIGAIVAPLTLVGAFLSLIPLLGIFSLGVTLYQMYCLVRASQAVYQMDTRTAMTVVVFPIIGFFALQLILLGSLI